MWGNIVSGLLSVAQGDSPEEILKKQAMATITGGTMPPGVDSATSTIAPHLAQTGAEQAIASGLTDTTLTGLQQEILSEVPQSAVNNSALQPQDFIGSHLTNDVNNQALMNNYSGFTNAVPDPLQAYPSFDNPVASTTEELAMADGGYGGGFLDGFGDGIGGVTDSLSEFTGMDRGDVSSFTLSQGANLLQPTPPEPIKHAPAGQGISRPTVDLTKTAGTPMTSFPNGGANQLTPEQIMKLKQQGIL